MRRKLTAASIAGADPEVVRWVRTNYPAECVATCPDKRQERHRETIRGTES